METYQSIITALSNTPFISAFTSEVTDNTIVMKCCYTIFRIEIEIIILDDLIHINCEFTRSANSTLDFYDGLITSTTSAITNIEKEYNFKLPTRTADKDIVIYSLIMFSITDWMRIRNSRMITYYHTD